MTATTNSKGGALRRRPVTPEEVAEMVRLRERGWTTRQIGEEIGRDFSTVSKHLGQYRERLWLEKAKPQVRRQRPVTGQERAFVEFYLGLEGYSLTAVAEALGRYPATIAQVCAREGIGYEPQRSGHHRRTPRIFNGERPDATPEEVQEMVSAARRIRTLAGTARAVGMSEQYVERVLQHHAPASWFAFIKMSGFDPGQIFERMAGDSVRREQGLREEYGLQSAADGRAGARSRARCRRALA